MFTLTFKGFIDLIYYCTTAEHDGNQLPLFFSSLWDLNRVLLNVHGYSAFCIISFVAAERVWMRYAGFLHHRNENGHFYPPFFVMVSALQLCMIWSKDAVMC
jgi:hypothetical protein